MKWFCIQAINNFSLPIDFHIMQVFMYLHPRSFSNENLDCLKLISKNIWNRKTILNVSDGSDTATSIYTSLLELNIAHRSMAVGGVHLNFLGLKRPILPFISEIHMHISMQYIQLYRNYVLLMSGISPSWQNKMINDETHLTPLTVSASLSCCTSKESWN